MHEKELQVAKPTSNGIIQGVIKIKSKCLDCKLYCHESSSEYSLASNVLVPSFLLLSKAALVSSFLSVFMNLIRL